MRARVRSGVIKRRRPFGYLIRNLVQLKRTPRYPSRLVFKSLFGTNLLGYLVHLPYRKNEFLAHSGGYFGPEERAKGQVALKDIG